MQEEEKDVHGEEGEEVEDEEDAASSSDEAMSESSEESPSDSESSDDDDAVMARHADSATLRVQLKVQLVLLPLPGRTYNSVVISRLLWGST